MNKERFKGIVTGVVAAALAAGLCVSAFAANRSITVSDGIRVVLNGQDFQPKDGNGAPAELFSYNGTVYAPIRAICEAAGMDVSYDSKTQTATITAKAEAPAETTQAPHPAVPSASGTLVDEAQAKQAALDHAKVSAGSATFTEVKLSTGSGAAHYELEFYSGNTEYEYKIDATTGKVLKFNQEYHDNYKTTKTTTGTISSDRAKEIALERAPGASVTKCKLDYDDGRQIYEIDLRDGFTKYECEVDAATGTVLKWEIDD